MDKTTSTIDTYIKSLLAPHDSTKDYGDFI